MQEVHVACPCCKNKRLFDADPTAVEGIIKIKCPICKAVVAVSFHQLFVRSFFVVLPEKFYFLALRKVGDICESSSHIRAGGAKIRHNNNLFQSLWAADQGEDKNTDF